MNKHGLLILLIVVFLGTEDAHPQRILGAVSAGMNLSQVDGDEKYGFKCFDIKDLEKIPSDLSEIRYWNLEQLKKCDPVKIVNDVLNFKDVSVKKQVSLTSLLS